MATADVLAKSAREKLATALNALQNSSDPPVELLELAEPIAQAMGILHRIERSRGNDLTGRELVSSHIRGTLDKLQQMTVSHEALDAVMEQVAGCLAAVHQLTRLPLPGAPPAPASSPGAGALRPPPSAAAAPASAPSSGAAAVKPTAHGVGPSVPSEITTPPAFGPAAAPTPASRIVANIPPPSPAQPTPAPVVPAAMAPTAPAAPIAIAPVAPSGTLAMAQPAAPSVTQRIAPAPAAVAPVPVVVAAAPPAPAAPPTAVASPASPASTTGRGTVRMDAPIVPASGFAPPPAAVTPAPAPAAHAPAAYRPPTPSSTGNVIVELGTHSVSNFYKGLSGNDVIEHGGLFVATYKIPKLGMQVNLRVLLPGDYEFQAIGVVQWIREAGASGEGADPGFGAKLTQITPEGRQLVYRYARNREPMFYDDL